MFYFRNKTLISEIKQGGVLFQVGGGFYFRNKCFISEIKHHLVLFQVGGSVLFQVGGDKIRKKNILPGRHTQKVSPRLFGWPRGEPKSVGGALCV